MDVHTFESFVGYSSIGDLGGRLHATVDKVTNTSFRSSVDEELPKVGFTEATRLVQSLSNYKPLSKLIVFFGLTGSSELVLTKTPQLPLKASTTCSLKKPSALMTSTPCEAREEAFSDSGFRVMARRANVLSLF